MSNYAWQKFHMAAEMLRNADDIKDALANAYSMELSLLNNADLPEEFEDRIMWLLNSLKLPDDVDSITGMGRAQSMINSLSDEELDEVVEEIFNLENELIMNE